MSTSERRFDLYVYPGGDLEAVCLPEWVDAGMVRERLKGARPAFLGLSLCRQEARELRELLLKAGIQNSPIPCEYRRAGISFENALVIAESHIRKEQERLPGRVWCEPYLLGGANAPMVWFFQSTSLAEDIHDDDLVVTVGIDKLDGHVVTNQELRRYQNQWEPNADLLLATDDLLDGDEQEQLKAAEYLLQRAKQDGVRAVLRLAREKSPFSKVREFIDRLMPV